MNPAPASTPAEAGPALTESQRCIFVELARAAAQGEPCPTNAALMAVSGLNTRGGITAAIEALALKGLIAVERGVNSRIVTIIATGHATRRPPCLPAPLAAGIAAPPIDRLAEGHCTGAELVAAIEAAARDLGMHAVELVRRMVSDPAQFLRQVAIADRPREHTCARVRALITGQPIPPAGSANWAAPVDPRPCGEDLAARIERDQAQRLARQLQWLQAEQQAYGLPRRGRLLSEMAA